jgi:ribose/xylose/arabinose/galactoside ABC-type transport system permease subunit
MGRRVGFAPVRERDWKRTGLASLLLVLSVFFLWVSFNGLFMLPGKYNLTVVSMVVVSVALAFGFAFASGRQFLSVRNSVRTKPRSVWSTTPMVVWFMVVVLFVGMLILKAL